MLYCPKHISPAVIDARDRFCEAVDEFHFFFQLVCPCCNERTFALFVGDKRSVRAECLRCKQSVIVYDLAYYPAATKIQGDEAFSRLNGHLHRGSLVFVSYEYGEFDDDQHFDPDDVSWCQIWIEENGTLVKVFDDETA